MGAILLYQDYVHNNGVLRARLEARFGAGHVRAVDAAGIAAGALEGAALLVMPGGADLYYCEKLDGAGNAAIRAFVESGGGYLGICAGAYYACAALDWARGESAPIAGARELAFYSGTAAGPVYEFIEDGDFSKSWDGAAAISFGGRTFPALYSGGPVFGGDERATVMARYAALPGQPAAIVSCAVGSGRAVLCGPHIEYTADSYARTIYRHRNPAYEWQQDVAARLMPGTAAQEALWQAVTGEALPAAAKTRHAA